MTKRIAILLAFTVAIIFLAGAGYRASTYIDESGSESVSTKADIKLLGLALQAFHRDMGRYPEEQEMPLALTGKAYLDKWPKDGWGHAYRYRKTSGTPHPFMLYSPGPNGIDENGDGDDINFWKLPAQ